MGLFSTLDPWPIEADYSEKAWRRMFAVAAVLQEVDPDVVERALWEFVRQADELPPTSDAEGGVPGWSKVFVLLRVAFDLPEAQGPMTSAYRGGWMGVTFEEPHRTVWARDLAWPVRWVGGRPQLAAGLTGYKGPPYMPDAEYRYFREQFEFRKLK